MELPPAHQGGTLTFTGLDLLVLATVNGSINLTSDVSFQDLHELVMYARGAGSDLTINSPISNIGILGLVAEDSLHLTTPGTMSVGKLDVITGSDLMLQIGGSLLLNDRLRLDVIVLPGASVASGANLTLNVTAITRIIRRLSFLIWLSRTGTTSARVEILL